MKEGIVKWFDERKGYGFIQHDKKDYFVHYNEIQVDGFKTLEEGQSVKFIPENDDKGRPNATHVWPMTPVKASRGPRKENPV